MSGARAPDVSVVGAGVVGLSVALTLARRGAAVTLIERAPLGPSASSVAGGMLAPAGEALLDDGDAETFRALLHARDRWPGFAGSVPDLRLERCGAELRLPAGEVEAWRVRAQSLGVDAQPGAAGLFLPQDWRVDPSAALQAMGRAAAAAGVEHQHAAVAAEGGRLLMDGKPLAGGRVVLAAGYAARALSPAAPELESLTPIKGQILDYQAGGLAGPILRAPGVYVSPTLTGARAGATMEVGRDDVQVEAEMARALHARACALDPRLRETPFQALAGVRAATPDGWPLVGRSRSGVWLATGVRRNGWLLAPLIAEMIADQLAGGSGGDLAQAFHPGRFTR